MTLRDLLIRIGFDVDVNKIKAVNNEIARTKTTAEATVGAIADVARRTADIGRGLTLGITLPILGIATASAKASGTMEQFTVQWEVLLGSQEKATQRMEELRNFANTTPFELTEVVEASRVLETLTKGAMSTGDGLKMVGDVASGTGMDFQGASIWIGRAYDGLKANRPIGEALARLQEVGAVSGDVRNKIEKLQKSGKGADAWKVLEGEFSRYGGMMEKQSMTLFGLLSTLKDAINTALAELGDEFIEDLKSIIKELIELTSKLVDVVKWFFDLPDPIKNTAIALAGLVAIVGPVLWALGTITSGVLSAFVTFSMFKGFLPLFAGAVRTAMASVSASLATNPLGWVLLAIGLFAGLVAVIWKYRDAIGGFLGTLKDSFVANFSPVLEFLYKIIQALASIVSFKLPAIDFDSLRGEAKKSMDDSGYKWGEHSREKNERSLIGSKWRNGVEVVDEAPASEKALPADDGGYKWGEYSRAKAERKVQEYAERQAGGRAQEVNLRVTSELQVPEGTTAQQKKYLEDFASQAIDKRIRSQLDLAMAGSGAIG